MTKVTAVSLKQMKWRTTVVVTDAGWSSSVARRAHNPEVAGSNPVPATEEPGISLRNQ